MDLVKYVTFFTIITAVGMLYDRYKKKWEPDEELKDDVLVKQYLLGENTILGGNKPTLWVHTEYNINARDWDNFGSRNSKKLNAKYIELCVESIIKYSGKSCNVVLISDKSFSNLIPGWTIDMNKLADPIKSHIRDLGLAKILYYYGGMLLPNNMLLLKDIRQLYDEMIGYKEMFVGEKVATNSAAVYSRFYPSRKLMGCIKNSKIMDGYIKRLEALISKDNTSEQDFDGNSDRYLYELSSNGKIQLVCGKLLGTKQKKHEVVLVDDLLSLNYINFCDRMYGIWLPEESIRKRSKYQWFLRLNREQLYESKTTLSKYLAISYGK